MTVGVGGSPVTVVCVTWRTHVCDMTQWNLWHDSLICLSVSVIHIYIHIYIYTYMPSHCRVRDMTHAYLWHDWMRTCDTTHWYIWQFSLTCVWHVSVVYVWHDWSMWVTRLTCIWLNMGWLRLVGSLKLQVSFAEYRLFYRARLQKRPIIWRSLLLVATP